MLSPIHVILVLKVLVYLCIEYIHRESSTRNTEHRGIIKELHRSCDNHVTSHVTTNHTHIYNYTSENFCVSIVALDMSSFRSDLNLDMSLTSPNNTSVCSVRSWASSTIITLEGEGQYGRGMWAWHEVRYL